MQVEIEDFKCYKQFNVKINQKGLILIEGASGSGKTTILNAIQFVLYNLNGSRIANKNPKVKLCVDGCEIIRSKHPNRLIVTLNEKKYFDLEAQCWIDQNIKICSVAQNGFDDFLMATSSERRLFLEKLAGFHSEQSILFEEKIFKKNKDLDQQKSVKQGQVELLFKQFQNANKGIECIDDLESELKQLESDRVEFASAKKIYENNLLHQKQKIEIEKLTIELKTLQNQIIGSEERKKLGEKLLNGQLRNQLISSLPAMNLQEIENELQKEREKQILNAKQMEKFTKFKKIKSELDGLSDFIISCPWENCLKPIIMIGQRVEKATEQPVSGKRKRSMEESERFYEASKFLKSFQNIQFDSKKLNELNEMHQQHILLSNKLKEIGNNFLNDDLENLKSLQEKIKQDEKNIERKKVVEQILKSFSPVPHEQVAEQIFNQDELIEREAKLKNKIKFHNEFLNSQKIKQEYNQYETEFQSLIAYLTKIQIIVRVWNESKTYCIENITAILQSKVNELIGDFFVKPLTISITCWRSMKNKNEKPGFEIVINDENNKLLVNELSGGEKSRLSIAFSCALAELNHSSFLLLDEAMAGLDFLNCQQVVKSLHQWAIDKSIAIVIIAHNISKEYFDQIISLEK